MKKRIFVILAVLTLLCVVSVTAFSEEGCAHSNTEIITGYAATCTDFGLTDGIKCVDCGSITKEQEIIPAIGHQKETIPGKAATCTDAGRTSGMRCSVCGATLKAQTIIPAKGHTWSEEVNEDGEFECLYCDEVKPDSTRLKGDINIDGKIDNTDVVLALRLKGKYDWAADMDNDNDIDNVDIVLIMRAKSM